jgi:hypothetical protein
MVVVRMVVNMVEAVAAGGEWFDWRWCSSVSDDLIQISSKSAVPKKLDD